MSPCHHSLLYLLLTKNRRIRSLEAHVAEIRAGQNNIQSALGEILSHLRRGGIIGSSSPPTYNQPFLGGSPSMHSIGSSSSMSNHTAGLVMADSSHSMHSQSISSSGNQYSGARPNVPPVMTGANQRSHRNSVSSSGMMDTSGHVDYHPPQLPPSYGGYTSPVAYNSHGQVLQSFTSNHQDANSQQTNMSSMRYSTSDNGTPQRPGHSHSLSLSSLSAASGSKRTAPPSSNVTSGESSDIEDEDNGELPARGLVAPWEVLRGLADVAIQRAAKVCATVLGARKSTSF